jgi:hypothetical protein
MRFFEVISSNFSSVDVCSSENGAQKWTTDLQNFQKDLQLFEIEEENFLKTEYIVPCVSNFTKEMCLNFPEAYAYRK